MSAKTRTQFRPSLDGLESRDVPSAIAPHFIIKGHPAPTFPGPGIIVPLSTTHTTTVTPSQTLGSPGGSVTPIHTPAGHSGGYWLSYPSSPLPIQVFRMR